MKAVFTTFAATTAGVVLSLLVTPGAAAAGRSMERGHSLGTAAWENRAPETVVDVADREDDKKALAIVGALLGLALLERANREEREDREESATSQVPARTSEDPPSPNALDGLVFPEIPTRPAWVEAIAADPGLGPDPDVATTQEVEAAPKDDPVRDAEPAPESEPSIVIPPPPPLADDLDKGQGLGEVFERADRAGETGY